MKIINCTWELENLGKRVLEIEIENNDVYNKKDILDLISNYDYIVIKVPMNMAGVNYQLSSMGFTMIETQFSVSKTYKSFDFDDRLVKILYPHVRLEEISTHSELDNVLSKISDDMFSTDRIYIDSHFKKGLSANRYKNWIKTEFENQTSLVTRIMYDDECIGFGMERFLNECYHGLLGGIFEEYQSQGLSICVGGIRFIDSHKKGIPFKKMKTAISSNNIPVVEIYNYLHFKVDKMTYVFVKHNT